MEQVRQNGNIPLAETDRVSQISSRYIDQIQHFISPTATYQFRLGLLSIILLMAVNGLGPSAITINTAISLYPKTIQVANLTLTETIFHIDEMNGNDPSILVLDDSNVAIRLEMFTNSTYGFRVEGGNKNVLIPWPSPDHLFSEEVMTYKTSVIFYNFSCSWRKPVISGSPVTSVWNISGELFEIEESDSASEEMVDEGMFLFCPPPIRPLRFLKTDLLPNSNCSVSHSILAGNVAQARSEKPPQHLCLHNKRGNRSQWPPNEWNRVLE